MKPLSLAGKHYTGHSVDEFMTLILIQSIATGIQLEGSTPTGVLIINAHKIISQEKGTVEMELKENNIEFLTGYNTATVTFSNRRHITRIKKLYAQRGDEFISYHENADGSICATLPLSWVKINPGAKHDPSKPKRQMSEEQKKKLLEALARGRAARKSN